MPAPFRYKMDILGALKAAGYTTYKLRKDQVFGEHTIESFRKNEVVNLLCLGRVCGILGCDIGDLIEFDPAAGSGSGAEG